MIIREEWLAKMERAGIADKPLIYIYGKPFTQRQLVKNKLLWMQVIKSI